MKTVGIRPKGFTRRVPRGFTIVELLIVIVVIGILAAITVVAFNGISAKTENTKTAQAVAQYVKLVTNYATTYGVYPTSVVPPTAPPADFWTCLPYSTTTCASSSNTPSPCFGLNATTTNTTFKSELEKVATTLPAVSDKSSACSATQTFQGALIRVYNSGRSVSLHFGLSGNMTCPSIGGATLTSSSVATDTTRCAYSIPDFS